MIVLVPGRDFLALGSNNPAGRVTFVSRFFNRKAMELELVPKKKVEVKLEKWIKKPREMRTADKTGGYKPPISHLCKTCPVTFHLTFE
jgi:hypothetical protein